LDEKYINVKINDGMSKVDKTKKILNLDSLEPCYLYISKSSAVLNDTIGSIKKFLKGKINFDADFRIFDALDEINEEDFNNFVSMPSFFSTKKIAVIKNIDHLPSRLLKVLTGFLLAVNSKDSGIVFVITASKDKLNSKFIDAVKKVGQIKKLKSPLSDNLRKWVREKSEIDGIKFTDRAIAVLTESVNFESSLLKAEYEKLCTYIISEKEKIIDEKIVKSLVNSINPSNIFDLVDYLGSRSRGNALKALKAISDKNENLIGIVKLIHRMFKCFLYIKSDGGMEFARSYIENKINAPTYFVKKIVDKYAKYSRNYSETEIIKVFEILNTYDINFRKGEIEDKNLTQKLILEIINVNISS